MTEIISESMTMSNGGSAGKLENATTICVAVALVVSPRVEEAPE
jgi:hypothetical protein